MFGWFKKRVVNRMEKLLSFSQLATALALMKHYGLEEATSDAERNRRAAQASAAANYLFDQTPDPSHEQQLPLGCDPVFAIVPRAAPFERLAIIARVLRAESPCYPVTTGCRCASSSRPGRNQARRIRCETEGHENSPRGLGFFRPPSS
jgi:hypothetical protein